MSIACEGAMDDRALLAEIGTSLWGADWRSHLAAALRQPVGRVSEWEGNHAPVSAAAWKELREVVRLHALKLANLDQQIVRAFDAAYQRELKKQR
jgi:hypothetical protein